MMDLLANPLFLMSAMVFFLLFFKVPVGFALGAGSLLYLLITGESITIMAQYFTAYMNSFTLIAIPLFVICGEFMNLGGVTHRLIRLASAFVGHVPGGLAHVNVVTSILMAGMSGSSSSDAATTSLVLVPQMEREGYPRAFAAAVTAASATIGPVIPPSILIIIIGGMNELSIGRLFLGGVLPGFLMGFSMMAYTALIAGKRNFPKSKKWAGIKEFGIASKRAALPLLTPVIIMGGMMSGFFTPTEAASIAALYTFILGFFVYRQIKIKKLVQSCFNTIRITSNIMLIVGFAGVFGWILISEQVAMELTDWVQTVTQSPAVLLIFINLLLLLLGCFLSSTSLIVMLSPILFPLIESFGIDPIHFGIAMLLNLEIGQLTPPVGITSFVCLDVTKVPIAPYVKEIGPFLVVIFFVLIVTTYIPQVVLFIPNLVFGKAGVP